ncbi:MAG: PrsW family glutamic-type intramembrane protease [Acidobacteriota bacterium]
MRKPSQATWIIAGLILAVALVLGPVALLVIGFGTGLTGFISGFLMAVLPVPFYVSFALWIDRFEPEPPWLLVLAFVWGAAIATFFSLALNIFNEGLFTAILDASSANMLTTVVSAPFVEELAKGTALFLLFLWKRDHFDNVTDGIIYASMIGLGFAMTENVQYYGQAAAAEGSGGAVLVFVLRGIMGPFSHPLFTSMTGVGLGFSRESDRPLVKWLAPPLGLVGAILLHATWNLSASYGMAFFAAYFLIMIPAFLGVGVVAILSLRREANIIRAHLETVVAEGVLSRDDVLVVTSVWRRVGASTSALFERGFGMWRARRRFHALASELAFHSWRMNRDGTVDGQAEREELLGAVRAVRARLGLPVEIQLPEPALVARLTREIPMPVLPTQPGRLAASLVCTAGTLVGESFPIGYTGLQIGRDATSVQIVVRDPKVSKRHAWIGYGGEGLMVIDRGSTNGTWINGQRVTESPLRPGDRLEISDCVATFELQIPG